MKECVGWAGIKTPHAHPPTRKPATHAPDTHSPLPISLQQRSSASPSACLERVPPRNGYPRVLESQALWRPLFNWRTGRGPGRVSRLSKVHRSFFPCRPVLSIAHCLCLHNSIPLVPYLLPASPFFSSPSTTLPLFSPRSPSCTVSTIFKRSWRSRFTLDFITSSPPIVIFDEQLVLLQLYLLHSLRLLPSIYA